MTAQVAIVCDKCGDIGTVGPTPQEAREALPDWVRRRGEDFCPVCRAVDDARHRAAERSRGRTGDRLAAEVPARAPEVPALAPSTTDAATHGPL